MKNIPIILEGKPIHSIHFVGITGVAMTALAVYAKEAGIRVTGSDIAGDFPTHETLKRAKIDVMSGFRKENLDTDAQPDAVIYTGAHQGRENVEVVTAQELHIPVYPHGKALGLCMDGKQQVSVAGSHGKTTTSAMIATALMTVKKDPSYAIGCGDIRGIGAAGHCGKGTVFVAEADEYVTDPGHDQTPRFLWQHPDILVVTNIDYDHPDAYGSLNEVKQAFLLLQNQIVGRGVTIVNADDEKSTELLRSKKHVCVTYGFSQRAMYRVTNTHFSEGKTNFTVASDAGELHEFTLSVPGMHNVSNATAVVAALRNLDVSWEDIQVGLAAFRGTKRRFEYIGTCGDSIVYDDYAHHPYEIKKTLEAVRLWYPHKKIVALFQPHTYSRTKALLKEFTSCFSSADIVCMTDIYASARDDACHDTSIVPQLIKDITAQGVRAFYVASPDDVLHVLGSEHIHDAIILSMGAGDIYRWPYTLCAKGDTYEK